MKKIRWLVVCAALLWGYSSQGKDGLFQHKPKSPVIPPKFVGCEGSELYKNFSCMQTCRVQANNSAFRAYTEKTLGRAQSCHRCKDWEAGDTLLESVLRLHDGFSSDSILDTSSSKRSLEWVSRELRPKQWTAITHIEQHKGRLSSIGLGGRSQGGDNRKDRLMVGSWKNESLLKGEKFDLVLLDSLLPTLERLWPHGQNEIFDRLAPHLAAGGRMYVIGQDPESYPRRLQIPGQTAYQVYHAASLLHSVNQMHAAVEVHSGERSDRPLPLDWVLSAVRRSDHLEVASYQAFPAVWGAGALHAKLDLCETQLKRIAGVHLINGLRDSIRVLRDRVNSHPQLANNGLCYGIDYLVVIKRKQ